MAQKRIKMSLNGIEVGIGICFKKGGSFQLIYEVWNKTVTLCDKI